MNSLTFTKMRHYSSTFSGIDIRDAQGTRCGYILVFRSSPISGRPRVTEYRAFWNDPTEEQGYRLIGVYPTIHSSCSGQTPRLALAAAKRAARHRAEEGDGQIGYRCHLCSAPVWRDEESGRWPEHRCQNEEGPAILAEPPAVYPDNRSDPAAGETLADPLPLRESLSAAGGMCKTPRGLRLELGTEGPEIAPSVGGGLDGPPRSWGNDDPVRAAEYTWAAVRAYELLSDTGARARSAGLCLLSPDEYRFLRVRLSRLSNG